MEDQHIGTYEQKVKEKKHSLFSFTAYLGQAQVNTGKSHRA